MPYRGILSPDDPIPVEVIPSTIDSRVLLVCDHAGDAVPRSLHEQNLSREELSRHIAVDVNAYRVALTVANELNSTLVSQRYSRLVVDMNRPPESEESMPQFSDGTLIPFNQNLDNSERAARLAEIFTPYHDTITGLLDDMSPPCALIAIHSFTPKLKDANPRPWHVDLMSRTHGDFSLRLEQHLKAENPNLKIGQSQVFQMMDHRDFTIPFHAESRGILNVSVEIRNDMISNKEQIHAWGIMLARCIKASLHFEIHSSTSDCVTD